MILLCMFFIFILLHKGAYFSISSILHSIENDHNYCNSYRTSRINAVCGRADARKQNIIIIRWGNGDVNWMVIV